MRVRPADTACPYGARVTCTAGKGALGPEDAGDLAHAGDHVGGGNDGIYGDALVLSHLSHKLLAADDGGAGGGRGLGVAGIGCKHGNPRVAAGAVRQRRRAADQLHSAPPASVTPGCTGERRASHINSCLRIGIMRAQLCVRWRWPHGCNGWSCGEHV